MYNKTSNSNVEGSVTQKTSKEYVLSHDLEWIDKPRPTEIYLFLVHASRISRIGAGFGLIVICGMVLMTSGQFFAIPNENFLNSNTRTALISSSANR